MSLSSGSGHEKLPTVYVRRRYLPPLTLCIGFAILLAGFSLGHYYQWMPALLGRCGIVVTAALSFFTGAQAFDRRAQIVFSHDGVELALCQASRIRWNDIVHVECFRVRGQAAVAIFLTPEALARRPSESAHQMPVFAHEAFSGPPVWFTDEALEHSAAEIAAEIDARRRGVGGPITARALSRRAK